MNKQGNSGCYVVLLIVLGVLLLGTAYSLAGDTSPAWLNYLNQVP